MHVTLTYVIGVIIEVCKMLDKKYKVGDEIYGQLSIFGKINIHLEELTSRMQNWTYGYFGLG